MRKFLSVILISIIVLVLAACNGGDNQNEEENHENDELAFLEVDFEVPEAGMIGEAVELKATVTIGDEPVTEPEEVMFEIWEIEDEDRDNSDKIDATNNNDGTYTIEYEFDEAGEYEMYAHTTADDMHVMPKGEITITE